MSRTDLPRTSGMTPGSDMIGRSGESPLVARSSSSFIVWNHGCSRICLTSSGSRFTSVILLDGRERAQPGMRPPPGIAQSVMAVVRTVSPSRPITDRTSNSIGADAAGGVRVRPSLLSRPRPGDVGHESARRPHRRCHFGQQPGLHGHTPRNDPRGLQVDRPDRVAPAGTGWYRRLESIAGRTIVVPVGFAEPLTIWALRLRPSWTGWSRGLVAEVVVGYWMGSSPRTVVRNISRGESSG
jgi:hypothetical protein